MPPSVSEISALTIIARCGKPMKPGVDWVGIEQWRWGEKMNKSRLTSEIVWFANMSLNTRIKRKKEVREEYVEQKGLIFRLPDETLLSILKYFTTDELILAAGFVQLMFYVRIPTLSFSSLVSANGFVRSVTTKNSGAQSIWHRRPIPIGS